MDSYILFRRNSVFKGLGCGASSLARHWVDYGGREFHFKIKLLEWEVEFFLGFSQLTETLSGEHAGMSVPRAEFHSAITVFSGARPWALE
jgi:hypothetical protein